MKYHESKIDKDLRAWFGNDNTRALLRGVRLAEGVFRSLNSLDISFDYPITAIAGKNGAGKSTILALAACAFHNDPKGFKPLKRQKTYYTFSDFFVQHADEVPPEGIAIYYKIAHNNWTKGPLMPTGEGISNQIRQKVNGGKWNDYGRRIKRTTVFLGIERIVPHSERSQSRSYSKVFKAKPPSGWEQNVMDDVGFVLNKKYDNYTSLNHSKYSLPVVKCNDVIYSGFNMGAGENALFEIFSTIYAAGSGALIVVDEIELGLHAEAQRRFMDRLKKTCFNQKSQVICTTHSTEIFERLPNDARFYVETVGGKTKVTPGISSEYAFTKMSAKKGLELDIFVEDDIANAIILACLPSATRARVSIHVIGSASVLSRQLAACYLRAEKKPILAIFDGDQKSKLTDNLKHAKKMAENAAADFDGWFTERISFLPGDTWPEAWLLLKGVEILAVLSEVLNVEENELEDFIEYALQAGKHQEFHELQMQLGLDRQACLQHFATSIVKNFPEDFTQIKLAVATALGD